MKTVFGAVALIIVCSSSPLCARNDEVPCCLPGQPAFRLRRLLFWNKPKRSKTIRATAALCECKHGFVYHTKVRGFANPQTEGEIFVFESASLIQIKIEVAGDNWEKVRYDLCP